MSFAPHAKYQCWQVIDPATGQPPEQEDGTTWPHYADEAGALADIEERIQEWLADNPHELVSEVPQLEAALAFDLACLRLICDGCGAEWEDPEYGWTHMDPRDPLEFVALSEQGWLTVGRLHYCGNCADRCNRVGDEETATAPIPVSADQIALDLA